MTALVLRLKAAPAQPVDVSPLRPDLLAGLDEKALAGIQLQSGNRKLALGELFRITMGDADHLVVEGSTARLQRLGAGLASGRIEAYGDAGPYLGLGMSGGRIDLFGSAGIFAASGLAGGFINIEGDAGHMLAAARSGETVGTRGGAVFVHGRAGDRVAERMRRGIVLVRGEIGDYAATSMIGGTVVARTAGAAAGYGMRRGTILLQRAPHELLATFADSGPHDLGWIRMLNAHLRALGWTGALPSLRQRRLTGCLSEGGAGEILIDAG